MIQTWNGPAIPYVPRWVQDLPLWAWLVIIPLLILFNRDARNWLREWGRSSLPEDEGVEVSKTAFEKDKNLRL